MSRVFKEAHVQCQGNLKKTSAVNLDNSGIGVTGPVQNKDFDICDGVINSKCESIRVDFAMNDNNSLPQLEEKVVKL